MPLNAALSANTIESSVPSAGTAASADPATDPSDAPNPIAAAPTAPKPATNGLMSPSTPAMMGISATNGGVSLGLQSPSFRKEPFIWSSLVMRNPASLPAPRNSVRTRRHRDSIEVTPLDSVLVSEETCFMPSPRFFVSEAACLEVRARSSLEREALEAALACSTKRTALSRTRDPCSD